MKFKVGDVVLVTAGKDKGKKGAVLRVFSEEEKVLVDNVNLYVKHMKPMNGQAGQRMQKPRPMPTAKVAIINDEGKRDRIGYKIAKDGTKQRVFKKTGKLIPEPEKKKK
jgi:large subunit ribosomal protein L24